jgi:peptidoglycan/LPS O-acetylase OafA/YrhL
MAERNGHNATLDGLRGVAAVAVVWYHMTIQEHETTPYRGYLSVDFFFILSGLVVAGAYETRLQGSMSLFNFAKIRLIRLYPLIVLGTLFGFASKLVAFYHFSPHVSGISSLFSIFIALFFGLLLLPYSGMYGVEGDMFPLDTPLWSLMLEIWANFFYAAIVRFGSSKILMGVIISVIVLGGAALIPFALSQGGLSGGHSVATFSVGVARVGCAFFIGVGLHHILTPARVAALPSVPFPVLATFLFAALLAGPQFGDLCDVFAVLVIFPIIVALGFKDFVSPRWRRTALFWGAVSYPIYALHNATFVHFSHFQHRPKIELAGAFVVAFATVVGMSYVALKYYDEPLRNWLTRISQPAAPPAAASVMPGSVGGG